MLRWISAAIVSALIAYMSGQILAAEPEIPDVGALTEKVYVPALDAICGKGKDISQGCADVRAREIVDAYSYPWSAIGRVNFASVQIRHHCTGTLIGERLVLTAAHCLYNYWRRSWVPVESIIFVAGYQRGTQVAVSKASRYILPSVFDTSSRHFKGYRFEDDWALIELIDPIGVRAGYLGISAMDQAGLDDALASGAKLALSGYAGVRPHVQSLASDCVYAIIYATPKVIVHRCPAMGGDSGAPLLLISSERSVIIGTMSGFPGNGNEPIGVGPSPMAFRETLLEALGEDALAQSSTPQALSSGKPPSR